ncbi:hypothetical protein ACWDWV_34225, partial [Streptosporangium sandarakinum]
RSARPSLSERADIRNRLLHIPPRGCCRHSAPGASARDGRDAPAGPAGPGGHGGPGGVGLRFDAAYACRNFREDDWRHDFCVRAWNDYRGRNGLP